MKPHTLPSLIRFSSPFLALAVGLPTLPAAEFETDPYRVGVGIGYRANTDIDGGGDFDETRFSLNASRTFDLNERLRIEPIGTYRFSAYDFSGREPWDDIHSLRVTALGHYALDDKWAVLGGPSLGLSGESDADAGDSITFGGALAVSYRLTETLNVGAGFTASSQIEDDAQVWPLVILNWQIDEQWSIESGYTEVAGGGGPGGELRYQFTDRWTFAAGLQYQEKRFRLSDDAPVREGVGEDSSWPVYAKVTWQASAHTALELVGGVAIGGELLLENRNGRKVSQRDYDPAPLVGLRALFTF